jgi:hypothetical protein
MKRWRLRGVVGGLALVGKQAGVAQTAGRRRASRSTAPSAAVARRGTTCPGRSAGSRPGRIRRAACAPARWPGRAWSGPARRCSTRRVAVVHGHKGGLAAHGQAHVAGDQFLVNLGAQRHHVGPLFVGVGQGDAGGFVDARDLHVVANSTSHLSTPPSMGAALDGVGRAGQRNVAFAGQQARGGVQARSSRRRAGRPRTRRAGR